jgi:signal peptidase I
MKYLENERPHYFRTVIIWISNLLVIAVLAIFITELFGEQFVMSGSSMKGTILDQDMLLIDKVSYQLGSPERFDIILFEGADGTRSVKRIIGLPGETVQISDGQILINGAPLSYEQSGVIQVAGLAQEPVVLDADSYFVLGDNPSFSEDSRFEQVGSVKRSSIIGKVWFCFYPVKDIGALR